MKITSEIVNGVLGTLLSPKEPILQGEKRYLFWEIVARLVIGLNDISSISDQMDSLEEDQIRLDVKHDEETNEIEDEMIRLQEQCPHFSMTEQDSPTSFRTVTCNICGKILERETIGSN